MRGGEWVKSANISFGRFRSNRGEGARGEVLSSTTFLVQSLGKTKDRSNQLDLVRAAHDHQGGLGRSQEWVPGKGPATRPFLVIPPIFS